jgi:hypothetical protein
MLLRRQEKRADKPNANPEQPGNQKIFEIIAGDVDVEEDFDIPYANINAYTLFSQEFRPVLKQRYPNLTT